MKTLIKQRPDFARNQHWIAVAIRSPATISDVSSNSTVNGRKFGDRQIKEVARIIE